MTQLVQLQTIADDLAANGFSVFAISNDPIEVLAEFATKHRIEYPLLSDAASSVIKAFGIMNQLVEPGEGRGMRWHGIPYPGTYFLDSSGVVTDKDFHQHHARRASGVSVLARALGQEIDIAPDTVTSATTDQIAMRVGLSDPALQLELITKLIVDIEIPEGQHLYAPGAPEAFTPLSLNVTGPGLRVGEPIWPPGTPLTMTELDITCPTYQGHIRIAVPLTITSQAVRLGHELNQDAVEVSVVVDFQTCTEVTCGLPESASVELTVPVERLVEPDGLSIYAGRVEALEAETGNAVQ